MIVYFITRVALSGRSPVSTGITVAFEMLWSAASWTSMMGLQSILLPQLMVGPLVALVSAGNQLTSS